ncbi:MAG TPA: hypothetical protein DFS52_18105 [Myxococcales bacterium]|jgi:hypothetical protein|nr:hypothetical protein [Myxococcales bacterium]
MPQHLALIIVSILLLLPAAASAAHRGAVLLIPLDRNAYAPAAQLTEYLEDAVDKNSAYRLRRSDDLLGDPTPAQALQARKRVQTAVNEGKKLLASSQLDEAEASFRSGLIDVDNASAAMERCSEYCEALVHLAAVQVLKGEEQGARDALRDLLAVDRGHKFQGPAFGKHFKLLYREMQNSLSTEGRLSSVNVQATPPGGRVFLDGQYKGYAPLVIDGVPVGKHLLRIERPGFITFGQMVEVNGPEGTVVKPRLTPTSEFGSLEESLDAVVEELEREQGSKALMGLGAKLRVDRALVGTVRTSENRVRLELVLVDFASREKLARKARTFVGDEYGELPKEVQRFGNLILASAERRSDPKAATSKDPLDRRTGMEDWDEESSGGGRDNQPKAQPQKEEKSSIW